MHVIACVHMVIVYIYMCVCICMYTVCKYFNIYI